VLKPEVINYLKSAGVLFKEEEGSVIAKLRASPA
jgi:hypothetical protein